VDETTISLRFPIRACWMKRGQQKRLPAPTDTRLYHHLIGAYNWRTDAVSALHVERKNGQTFIEFLEYLLLECYPSQRMVLVMDNASYHHSAPVKAALSLFEHRVRVIWLPARCPDLNPIERYWRHLKDLACANKLYMSLEALAVAIEGIVAAQLDLTNKLRFAFSKDLH
jgi:transposase